MAIADQRDFSLICVNYICQNLLIYTESPQNQSKHVVFSFTIDFQGQLDFFSLECRTRAVFTDSYAVESLSPPLHYEILLKQKLK